MSSKSYSEVNRDRQKLIDRISISKLNGDAKVEKLILGTRYRPPTYKNCCASKHTPVEKIRVYSLDDNYFYGLNDLKILDLSGLGLVKLDPKTYSVLPNLEIQE